mmetsp:Transcript_26417/g.66128  ORF Transcript_26417/g.66128 Transcript_26417/m.66128 type:complete len:386 (+) Transcript_26417:274-1431(+)
MTAQQVQKYRVHLFLAGYFLSQAKPPRALISIPPTVPRLQRLRGPLRLGPLPEHLPHPERDIQRLRPIQPRIPRRRIHPLVEQHLPRHPPAQALRHGVRGHLQAQPAGENPLRVADLEEGRNLAEDEVVGAGADDAARGVRCGGGGDGGEVVVHGVAEPGDGEGCGGEGAEHGGEAAPEGLCAHADNEGDFARGVGRVEAADRREEVLDVGGRADLDGDGVGDAAEEFDVGVGVGAREVVLADPEEVGGGAEVAGGGVDVEGADEGGVVVQVAGFVGREELGGPEGLVVGDIEAARSREVQCVGHSSNHSPRLHHRLLIRGLNRDLLHDPQPMAHRLARLRCRPQQIQPTRAHRVRLQHVLRLHLGLRARGEKPREPPDLDDGEA